MAYGTPKINSDDVKKSILQAIERKLNECADIFQSGLAYYGYLCEFSLELHVIARDENKAKIHGLASEGFENPRHEEGGTEVKKPVVKRAATKGSIAKGKKYEVSQTGS